MASLIYKSGRGTVQWADARKKRWTVALGVISRKNAERARGHIEDLIYSRIQNVAPERATAEWAAGLGDKLHAKLARHGLVKPRQAKAATELGAFLTRYIDGRKGELKDRSRSILGQVKKHLVAHFGERQAIEHITRGDAKDYRRHLASKLSQATVSMHVVRARMMFADAVDRNLIPSNPFDKLYAGPQNNDARKVYVDKATVAKVIDACPSIDWRLLFALARYAGLRTPSESYRLRWSDVLWDQRRMIVHASKTEHHEGKDKRIVPITPDLYPLLQEAFDAAPEGSEFVVGGRRPGNPNTTAGKIIARAGLTPWAKPFQNLRASCQTDWCERLPVATVCAMIGNSEVVAQRHYLMPKDEHYNLLVGIGSGRAALGAAQPDEMEGNEMPENPEKLDSKADELALDYPRQGFNPRVKLLRKLTSARRALQKQLRGATEATYEHDIRALAELEQAIAHARASAQGGVPHA